MIEVLAAFLIGAAVAVGCVWAGFWLARVEGSPEVVLPESFGSTVLDAAVWDDEG